ncbi:MAG TPA: DinB family protein [Ramlibacter sp.]|jgi:uncharacterized damage-inducible protein DinB|uniref:DinB family protein n=1 Tax=Ramlibacter sp. TaxID=1917967 RepID=UPI002D491269|nr:DinB family protein [Ramlibacter sp.]HZY18555.1 DinB family protein [Ramlibacter sp.]
MDASHPIHMLLRYTAWANARLYDALARLPEEGLHAPRPGRPAGVIGVLGHIHVVGRIWKGHLSGQPHGLRSRTPEQVASLAQLRSWQAEQDQWYLGEAGRLSAAQLAQVVEFRFVDGGAGAMRRDAMLLHVANHATYHRGYVADMLYETGFRPPTMDLPVFVRDVEPPAAAAAEAAGAADSLSGPVGGTLAP